MATPKKVISYAADDFQNAGQIPNECLALERAAAQWLPWGASMGACWADPGLVLTALPCPTLKHFVIRKLELAAHVSQPVSARFPKLF